MFPTGLSHLMLIKGNISITVLPKIVLETTLIQACLSPDQTRMQLIKNEFVIPQRYSQTLLSITVRIQMLRCFVEFRCLV